MSGLIIRIVRQLGNDKRTLMLILVAPILILSLLYLLLGESTYVPKIAITKDVPSGLLEALAGQNVALTVLDQAEDGIRLLEDNQVDAVVTLDQFGMRVTMLKAYSIKASDITQILKAATAKINPGSSVHMFYLYGKGDSTAFAGLGHILLGVLSYFFVFIISGISFVRERETGTLERMMATPVKCFEVIGGYTAGYGLFAAAQSILVILFTKYVLGIEFAGSVLLAVLIMVLLAFTAVSTGAFVSIFAKNEFQVMQFIPIIIIPQVFFSGLIPIDTLPYGLGVLAWFSPVYYGCTGLENVLVKGSGLEGIWFSLVILLLFIILLFFLNVITLKKYRQR
jgi:ABC-2 type transport system permease protein